MASYRCYFLNSERHIVGVHELPECRSDDEARRIALTMLIQGNHGGVAVWERDRKVYEAMA
jgi:hypothetical protein